MTPRPPPSSSPTRPDGSGCTGGGGPVQAAAGGVGSGAVQLGKAAGARVIGVVGGAQKAEVARALGADVVVDRHTQDFVEVVKEVTGGGGAGGGYAPVGGGGDT